MVYKWKNSVLTAVCGKTTRYQLVVLLWTTGSNFKKVVTPPGPERVLGVRFVFQGSLLSKQFVL